MPKITWSGDKELVKGLKERANMELVKKVVRKHTAGLQEQAQRNARFRGHFEGKRFVAPTGTLKRSIRSELSFDRLTGTVGPTVHYGGYVEWGTRFMSAQPYLKPAFTTVKSQFIADLKKLV